MLAGRSVRLHAGLPAAGSGAAAVPRLSSRALRRTVRPRQADPKQGYHTVEEAVRQEALAKWFEPEDNARCSPTTGGVNNVVEYIDSNKGKYILRIYNNGGKSEKVVFEHAILEQLAQQALSVETPKTLPSKAGRSHELLSSGAESCVFRVIPGSLAKTTSPEEVGRATGELNAAMGKLKLDMEPPIAPYFDLFNVHHTIAGNDALFYKEAAENPELQAPECKDAVAALVAEIKRLVQKIEDPRVGFKAQGLPLQWVHGDAHYDNLLVVPSPEGEKVSGILDFEFCSYDWRAMELAVALSKYVGEEEPLALCTRFFDGFSQHREMTEGELDAMPDLINLRIASNVVYFTSRALGKEDTIEALSSRANTYAKRIEWVNANRDALTGMLKQKMAEARKAKRVAA